MSVLSTVLFVCLAQCLRHGIIFEKHVSHVAKSRQKSESKNLKQVLRKVIQVI